MAGIRIGQQAFSGDFVRKDSVDKRVLSQLSGVPFLPNYAIFEENGTFVVPSGVERVLALVISGGGGGGSNGGGGGGICSGFINVQPYTCIQNIIGVGGKGIKRKNTNEDSLRQGGTSSFGAFITCIGRKGNNYLASISISKNVQRVVYALGGISLYGTGGEGTGAGSYGYSYVPCNSNSLIGMLQTFSLFGGDGRSVHYQNQGYSGIYTIGSGAGEGTGKDPFLLYQLALGQLPGGTGKGGMGAENGRSVTAPSPGYGGGGGSGVYDSQNIFSVGNGGGSGGGINGGVSKIGGEEIGGNGAPGVVCVFW